MERSTRDDATSAAPALASELVAACEAAWSSIQRRHPGVPDAVIILGSGVERGRLVKLGHWWSGRWIADGQVRGEVLLAGEALHLKPEDVFEVLLHEAAHGLNAHLGIKDTSRGGRYHNARFRQTAEDFGLRVATAPPFGWASTALTEQATELYRSEIASIGDALRIARRLNTATTIGVEGTTGGETTSENGERETGSKNPPAQCGCGRKMRMAPATLAAGPVICGLCNEQFTTTPHRQQRADQQQEAVLDDNVDRSFIDRRRDALGQARALHPSAGLSAPRRERRPNEADGLRILALATESPEGIASLAAAGAWYHAWHTGLEEPIVANDAIEVAACNHVARALLKLDHTLTGATVNLAGREWMIGDRVVVGRHSVEQFDADGELIPPTGVPGVVAGVDPGSHCVVVDFPIHGTNRFTDTTLAAAALDYGYAVLATDHGAPQVDLRLLDLAPAASEGRWPELER